MVRIFAYIEHHDGRPDDSAWELAGAARKIDATAPLTAVVTGCGCALDAVANALCTVFAEVWKIGHPALDYPNAEVVRAALVHVLPAGGIVLVPHAHFGIDLAPGLSVKMNAGFVSDVLAIEGIESGWLKVVRQELGGQVSAHVLCNLASGAVITVRPSAFQPILTASATGHVVDKSAEVGTLPSRRRYLQTIVPEAGDVDITRHALLVSVGRGIQDKDNIALAEELAAALGAAVSCSRPVVDARWLPKSRQVGSSGQTVRPKVYLACGISGSFQHLAGLKGNPFIVAINKNPKAPIFQVASVGIVDDIVEFLPALTERINRPSLKKSA